MGFQVIVQYYTDVSSKFPTAFASNSYHMKVGVVASFGPSLITFRGPMLSAFVDSGHEVVACAPEIDSRVGEALRSLGVRFVSIPLARRSLSPIHDCSYAVNLARFFRREGVQIALAYTIKPVIYASMAARYSGLDNMHSLITGLGYTFSALAYRSRWLTYITTILYRVALTRNRTVFFQNPDDKELFIDRHLINPQQAVLVNGSGVDLLQFPALPLASGPPVFLLIARLLKSKGIVEFIEAAGRIKQKFPECQFKLVGPFEKGVDCVSASVVHDAANRGIIEYLGELSDVRAAFASATVFVLPTYYREGIPRTILEALSCARAIITTNLPGCRETVRDGFNGFFVEPRNVGNLAAVMERFITQPAFARDFGANSRKMAEERFDVHGVNRVIMARMGL